jgi:hypothetical protein
MATKTGSAERKVKQSKKIKAGDYELLHSSLIYKVWYEYLQEIRTCENIMNLDWMNDDLQRISWNKTVNYQKELWFQKLSSRFGGYGHKWERLLGTEKKSRTFWSQYDAWAIGNKDIETTLDTYSSDQWKKNIFGTKDKKSNTWKKLFGVKKTVAASKLSPGDLRHAKSGNQSVSSNELLIKINLAENSRKDIDDAIQTILSEELWKLSRGRGKSIKKANDAQFQIDGVVDVRSLKRRLDIGILDRDYKLDLDSLIKMLQNKRKKYDELYEKQSTDKVRRRIQRMVSRDRRAHRTTLKSVINGRFDT